MITGAVNSKSSLKGKINNATEYIYPTLENLEITPSKQEQTFNHPNSDGYDEIKVNGVTSAIDENIVAENIKENVEILGVKGTYVGAKYRPKRISFNYYDGTSLDYELSNLDTSNITDMRSLFGNCSKVTNLDLRNFNTSNVTNMNAVFMYCSAITSLDLSNFNTSKVTNMSSMFSSCTKLTSIDVSTFNTRKVTTMSSMFSSCEALTRLDLSNFYIDSVTDIGSMFSGCEKLQYLDIRNFNFTSKISTNRYFLRYVPSTCEIIVKDETAKTYIKNNFGTFNVKTVAEIGG